ncbi:hypothetical protein P3T42_005491 [Paraburkholderia sp. GAS38]
MAQAIVVAAVPQNNAPDRHATATLLSGTSAATTTNSVCATRNAHAGTLRLWVRLMPLRASQSVK